MWLRALALSVPNTEPKLWDSTDDSSPRGAMLGGNLDKEVEL
jgi:hypothetical protein